MLERMKGLLRDEEGQGMAEYGLILALIAVVAVAGLLVLGPKISGKFNTISNSL